MDCRPGPHQALKPKDWPGCQKQVHDDCRSDAPDDRLVSQVVYSKDHGGQRRQQGQDEQRQGLLEIPEIDGQKNGQRGTAASEAKGENRTTPTSKPGQNKP